MAAGTSSITRRPAAVRIVRAYRPSVTCSTPGMAREARNPSRDSRVEGLAAGQPEREPGAVSRLPVPVAALARRGPVRSGPAAAGPQRGRRLAVGLLEARVELADAGEAARERDLGDRHARLPQQPPRGLQPHRPGQRERARPEFGHHQAVQVAFGHGQPARQPGDPVLIDVSVGDQPHRAGDEVGAGVPLRRAGARLRPAPAAGPESGRLRGPLMREEPHVLARRGAGRADRPAVDARAGDPDEEEPVEPGVAGDRGPVAGVEVQRHNLIQAEVGR